MQKESIELFYEETYQYTSSTQEQFETYERNYVLCSQTNLSRSK
jgi:hypothetical protein